MALAPPRALDALLSDRRPAPRLPTAAGPPAETARVCCCLAICTPPLGSVRWGLSQFLAGTSAWPHGIPLLQWVDGSECGLAAPQQRHPRLQRRLLLPGCVRPRHL